MATLRDISAADEAILPQRPRLVAEDPPSGASVGRWLVRALMVVVALLFCGVVWMAYQETIGQTGDPPLIRADAGVYKRSPGPTETAAVDGDDSTMASNAFGDKRPPPHQEKILSRGTASPRNLEEADPALATPPPAPPEPMVVASTPPAILPAPVMAAPPAVPAPVTALPTIPAPVKPPAHPSVAVLAPPPGVPAAPSKAEAPPIRLAAPEPGAGPPAKPMAMPAPTAPQVTARPAPQAVANPPILSRPEAAQPPARVAVAPPGPTSQPPQAPQPTTTYPSAQGTWAIQLAALSNREAVDRAWAKMRSEHPDVLGGLGLRVAEVMASAGRLYRMQAAGFADRDAAARACVNLKSQGQDCMVVATAR